ncbi:MAG: glycosyltransferase family 4 protein [Chloroflexota bacterium]|nr:glycosyltransferase family 4 protein [Chloroflexota bacterium]
MKLLQVVWNFPDTVMRPFDMYYFYWPMQEARLRGWDAEVLTFQVNSQQPVEEFIDGIHIRRCPAGQRKGRPFSWPFMHALLTTDADIIHCHGYAEGRSELAILLARLRGRPVIFTPHFHVYPKRRPLRELYDRTVGRFFFNMSSRVIVFTHYTCQQLIALGVRPQKLCIVPHVVRPDVFHETDAEHEPGQLLLQAGVTGSPLILGVGQLIERKGWEFTVRCLPMIVARFPEAKLLIIGPSQPAEPVFRQRLMALAAELGVSEHIQILQDNTPAFILDAYRSATILTHPSFVESFGMVLLEAMIAKLPVVAHNGTGMPCIVDDQASGFVVDVRDTEAYTQALLALLSDAQLRQRMGEEAWHQALSRYNQQEIAAQLFAIYAEVTGTPGDLLRPPEVRPPIGTTVVHSAKHE